MLHIARRSGAALGLALALLPLALSACRSSRTQAPTPLFAAQPRLHLPGRALVDAEHYALELELDPAGRSLRGLCRIELSAVRDRVAVVELDLLGLQVFSVRDGAGERLPYEQRDGKLLVRVDPPLRREQGLELSISYGGRPQGGMWFTAERDGIPTQVFTQGECEDSRRWFPCIDDPADRATSELVVDMPAGWISVAAGERLESRLEGRRRIDRWRTSTPHPAYLTTLVAGDLEVVEEDWRGLPLWYVAERRYREQLAPAFADTGPGLDFLEQVTGQRYPYAKYSQACVEGFPFGGMENLSASTLNDRTLGDERARRDGGSTGLVLHELAHQWFGNLLTCRDWSHIWLNEGFATYMTLLYFERTRGLDEFRVQLGDMQQGYVQADVGQGRRPIVWALYKEPLDLFFGGQAYAGGATRLHLLRHELGDEHFFAGLRRYVADNAGRGVVTEDLRLAFEAASGRDLSAFFEQWLLSPGYPELDVRWTFVEPSRVLRLDVEQLQEAAGGTPSAFRFTVDVELRTRSTTNVQRIEVDKRRKRFELPCAEPPLWVRFDKHSAVPKTLRVQASDEEWMAIAAGDDDVNGRREALAALGRSIASERTHDKRERALEVVVRRLREDPVPAVRVAAARALGEARGSDARFHLTFAATSDPQALVRSAALSELRVFGVDPALASLAAQCFEEGFSWGTMSAAAGLYVVAAPEQAFDWILARLEVESPHDRLRAALVEQLAGLRHPGLAAELVRLAEDRSSSVSVRAAALSGLGRAGRGDARARRLLVDALDSHELALRRAAVAGVVELGDPSVVKELEAAYPAAVLATERRAIEDAIAKLRAAAAG